MKTEANINGKKQNITQTQAIVMVLMKIARDPKDKRCIQAAQTLIQLSGATKSEAETRLLEAQTKMLEAKVDMLTGADTTALDKLDNILKEMKNDAEIKSETERIYSKC